jgi:hypothetical protein
VVDNDRRELMQLTTAAAVKQFCRDRVYAAAENAGYGALFEGRYKCCRNFLQLAFSFCKKVLDSCRDTPRSTGNKTLHT